MSSLRDLTMTLALDIAALPNSADGAVPVTMDSVKRRFASLTRAVADGLTVAYKNISLAANTTDGDLDLTAFVDQLSGDTIAFSKIAAIVVTNDTEDPTALLWADTGSATGWAAPYSGWRAFCYGLDAKGGNFPCPVVNMNTNTSFDWDVVASTTDTINLNSNTPATATTLTGRLIIIGWV